MSDNRVALNNIKNLWRQVYNENRSNFINDVADHFGVQPVTVRTNWLSKDYSVPVKYRAEFIKMLQNLIANQNNVLA